MKKKTKEIVCPLCNKRMKVTIYENDEILINTKNCKHDETKINNKKILEEIMIRIKDEFYD